MKHTSFITASALLAALALSAAPAAAQARGGHVGGGGGRAVVGRAAPRVGPAPRFVSRGRFGGVPFRSYRSFYGFGFYGYPYGLGFGLYGAYGYPYGFYGYPYGYGYGFGYPYGYAGYASFGYGGYYGYPGYYEAPGGYAAGVEGEAYGGVRIESRDRDAQVFADGYYVGIVDDFNGTYQHLNLRPGPHRIEIRSPNAPPLTFDVNVEPGRTITYRAGVR
jgi:hypothetical protein